MKPLHLRQAARLIVVDQKGDILLVRYDDGCEGPASYWVPPGGGLEPGEEPRDAAARELREETGLVAEIGRELWTCESEFETSSGPVRQFETFYWVALETMAPVVINRSAEQIREHRWWRLGELLATVETIYPVGCKEQLRSVFDGC